MWENQLIIMIMIEIENFFVVIKGTLSPKTKGCPKKVFLSEMSKFVSKSLNKITNHPFQDIYVKIYTISYYSGFYSSLTDKNWANGGPLEFLLKDEEKG